MKRIVGYCDPLSVEPGRPVRFRVSSLDGDFDATVVRLWCGDVSPDGHGFDEEVIATGVDGRHRRFEQPIRPGSFASIEANDFLESLDSLLLEVAVWPTAPGGRRQTLVASHGATGGFELALDEQGRPLAEVGGPDARTRLECSSSLPRRRWTTLRLSLDRASGVARLDVRTLAHGPAERAPHEQVTCRVGPDVRPGSDGPLTFAASRAVDGIGPGTYDHHHDGSGVVFSSHLRPILNLRPKCGVWSFTADANVTAWLHHTGTDHDAITDDLLHERGIEVLGRYRVIVTGTHPEYWTTPMLDALDQFLSSGGRLVYLGANGFYWRAAFHPAAPAAVEVRRAEDGTRAWIAEPGEYHHEATGEFGGLRRRIGRPPNRVAGVGFAAQGFSRSGSYRWTATRQDPRVDFAVDGLSERDVLGDHGSVSDVVFFETSSGGAVFSASSIAWAASLASNGYDNDFARLTANVLRRFADPEPFDPM